ncbi:MAG: hypothetical protein ABIJ40_12305 [Bacteroidota bacterium]
MQLSEIQAQIRALTDETSTTDPTDATLLYFINWRYQDLVAKITKVYQKYFITTATESTVDGTQNYDLPQDASSRCEVKKLIQVQISYDGTNWDIAKKDDKRDSVITEDELNVSHTRNNPHYYILGNIIYFDPIPDYSGTDNIKFWYVERQADLSAAGDKPNIPDDYHRLIISGAAADLKKRDDNFAAAQNYENDYAGGIKNMLEDLARRDISSVEEVEDVADTPVFDNETYVSPSSLS